MDKGGIEKDDKRSKFTSISFIVRLHCFRSLIDFIASVLCLVHADLVDELSLPVLPVAPPAHLIAMNAPMASGRKDTPGIDAALVSCVDRVYWAISMN